MPTSLASRPTTARGASGRWGIARELARACAVLIALAGPAAAEGDYRSLVERYAAGDRYGPVRELEWQDPERLEDSVAAVLAGLKDPAPDAQRRERLLRAGTLLHTDRAWLDLRDGRRAEFERQVRWAWSYVLIVDEVAAATPALLSFARRWYLLQGIRGHDRLDAAHARTFIEQGLRRFPDDPPLLLAQGSLDETLAQLEALRRGIEDPDQPTLSRFRGPQRPLVERRVLLKRAEDAYRRTLARDAALAEARLRLGRVLQLQGHAREAEQELRRVLREGGDAELSYLAHLFLGRLRQDQGHLEDAAGEYRAAAAGAPRSPTAPLALGQVLDRLGDRPGALAALDDALSRRLSEPPVLDAWWAYFYGQARFGEALVEALRREGGR